VEIELAADREGAEQDKMPAVIQRNTPRLADAAKRSRPQSAALSSIEAL